jgi:hypothetical protein
MFEFGEFHQQSGTDMRDVTIAYATLGPRNTTMERM